jgi:hypothetical protein
MTHVGVLAEENPLPDGCVCRFVTSDTGEVLEFVWNRACPRHTVAGDPSNKDDHDAC